MNGSSLGGERIFELKLWMEYFDWDGNEGCDDMMVDR